VLARTLHRGKRKKGKNTTCKRAYPYRSVFFCSQAAYVPCEQGRGVKGWGKIELKKGEKGKKASNLDSLPLAKAHDIHQKGEEKAPKKTLRRKGREEGEIRNRSPLASAFASYS